MRGLNAYFVTSGSGMPMGSGYWVIYAPTEEQARDIAFKACPDGRWAFMYSSIEDVHPTDRKLLGVYVPDQYRMRIWLGSPEPEALS